MKFYNGVSTGVKRNQKKRKENRDPKIEEQGVLVTQWLGQNLLTTDSYIGGLMQSFVYPTPTQSTYRMFQNSNEYMYRLLVSNTAKLSGLLQVSRRKLNHLLEGFPFQI